MGQVRTRKANPASNGKQPANGATSETKHVRNTLLTWDQIPSWSQCVYAFGLANAHYVDFNRDNEYILSGYRAISGSYKRSIDSIFSIHNETVNIHSHLIGSLVFCALPIPVYNQLHSRYATASLADIIVFSTFFIGIATCLFLSATFHIVCNHSKDVHLFANQLDYLGIIVLMWGSTIPYVYYGFFCSHNLQIVYYSLVSVLGSVCTYATLHPLFRRPKYRTFRMIMYSGLGFSFIIPVVHAVAKFGWEVQVRRMSLDWLALMTTLNLIGGVMYAMRIPERWYPYTFDIWGASHQLMHCFVICAGVAHLFGLIRAFDYAHGEGDACSA